MIFPGFPGVPSFLQVFQVEWEPCSTPNCACTKIAYCDGGTRLVFDEVIPY